MTSRWSSKWTSLLAGISCTWGVANFFKFPYLIQKYNGGVFLIPYLLMMLAVGPPVLQLEMTMGQLFQTDVVSAMAFISPKMRGVGYVMVLTAVMIASYYACFIGWMAIYFVQAFQSKMPWSSVENHVPCVLPNGVALSQAEYFMLHDVIGVFKKTIQEGSVICTLVARDAGYNMRWDIGGAILFVWAVVYICLCKGVRYTSRVVYITMLFSISMILVLFVQSLCLENAAEGINAFLGQWDFSHLASATIWVEALCQVLYTLTLSMSVMVTYGSYNRRDKRILSDVIAIVLVNILYSIFTAIIVWSTLGYYAKSMNMDVRSIPEAKIKSLGLIMVVYLVALDSLPYARYWCALFFVALFMLSIGSAFSLIEGIYAFIHNTAWGQKYSRPVVLIMAILPSLLLGLLYTQSTGLFWLFLIDRLVQYVMIVTTILLTISVGWIWGTIDAQKTVGRMSSRLYTAGFLIACLTCGSITFLFGNSATRDDQQVHSSHELIMGIAAFVILFFAFACISYQTSRNLFKNWFNVVFHAGPEPFINYWLALSSNIDPISGVTIYLGYGNTFEDRIALKYGTYWKFMVKYFLPLVLTFLLFAKMRVDDGSVGESYLSVYTVFASVWLIGSALLILKPMYSESLYPNQSSARLTEETTKSHAIPNSPGRDDYACINI